MTVWMSRDTMAEYIEVWTCKPGFERFPSGNVVFIPQDDCSKVGFVMLDFSPTKVDRGECIEVTWPGMVSVGQGGE